MCNLILSFIKKKCKSYCSNYFSVTHLIILMYYVQRYKYNKRKKTFYIWTYVRTFFFLEQLAMLKALFYSQCRYTCHVFVSYLNAAVLNYSDNLSVVLTKVAPNKSLVVH